MTTSLPHLTVSWNKKIAKPTISVQDGVFPDGSGLVVGVSGYRPNPVVRENSHRAVAVVGAPVLCERVSPIKVAEEALVALDLKNFVRGLNGQFLLMVLDKDRRHLSIVNDRFNGVPIYWAEVGGEFLASTLYYDIFRRIRHAPGVRLRQDTMFQFLWLSRVLMDATYDTASKFLMPATILDVEPKKTSQERYWRPSFLKETSRSLRESSDEYVKLLRGSVRRLTSDDRQVSYGHFLSGGHDSRSVLAAFPQPPECLTVAFSNNLEVDCARKAAASVGAPHHFIQLRDDHMVRHFDDSVRLCGGMYSFLDALFIGLEAQVRPVADVVLHGHGLDYLFQGMYLPAKLIHFLGRPTFFRRLQPLEGNLIDRYLFEIPFRIKGVDILSLIREDMQLSTMDVLRDAVSGVLEDGRDICQTNYDRWEYLIIHALGRHYSRPNIDSKLTCSEQRTPCFDNDLFDFYLSLSAGQRVQGEIMRLALNTMNPELGRIPTGNWGMPAGASPSVKTAWLIGRKLLRHMTGNPRLRAPALSDRTWPDRESYLRNNLRLVDEVRSALFSRELEDTITVFNWPALRKQGEAWLDGVEGGAAFLMALATLHRFLVLSG